MNKKHDSEGGVKSTRFLIDNLKEEALPDHLLSPDSLTRKKREEKRNFADLQYYLLIKSLYLYRNIIQFLNKKNKNNKNIHLPKVEIIHFNLNQDFNKLLDKYLSEEQFYKIKGLKEKSAVFASYLTSKITQLNSFIKQEEKEIALLRNEMIDLRNEVANAWNNNFKKYESDPDFESVKIPIILYDEFGNTLLDETISLSKEKYLTFAEQIGDDIRTNDIPFYEIEQFLKEKIDFLIATELNIALPKIELTSFSKIIQRGLPQQFLLDYMLKDASHSQLLIEKMATLLDKQKQLAESFYKKEAALMCLTEIKHLKEMNDYLLSECDKMLNLEVKNENRLPFVDDSVKSASDNLNLLFDEFSFVQENFENKMNQSEKDTIQTNDIIARLNRFKTETLVTLKTDSDDDQELIASLDDLLKESDSLWNNRNLAENSTEIKLDKEIPQVGLKP